MTFSQNYYLIESLHILNKKDIIIVRRRVKVVLHSKFRILYRNKLHSL